MTAKALFILATALFAGVVVGGDTSDSLDLGTTEVTARKRTEDLRYVPLSLTVLPERALEDRGIRSLKEASFFVPNLFISQFASRRSSFPFVRGIGSGQGEPTVTVFVDGVPRLTSNTNNLEFLDIERIEFLRGSLGTLYGRNTLGGAIHVITAQPTAEMRRSFSAELGDYNREKYTLSLSGPAGPMDNTNYSFGLGYSRRDGFTKNDLTGNDVDDREATFGRAKFLYAPDGDTDITFSIYGEHDRDGGFTLFDLASLSRNPYHLSHDYDGFTERDVIAPSITVRRHGDAIDFTSITAIERWSAKDVTDLDFTAIDLLRRGTDEDQVQFYQEFRINSAEDSPAAFRGNPLKFVAGISGSYSDFEHESYSEMSPTFQAFLAGAGRPDIVALTFPIRDTAEYTLKDTTFGVWGHGTLTLSDKLDMSLGLRYEYERKHTDFNLAALDLSSVTSPPPIVTDRQGFTKTYDAFLPRVDLAYRNSDRIMTYVSAAKGFRGGGYNRNVFPGGSFTVDEEKSWTYEAGVKTTWLGDRLQVNFALFQIDWDDMQLDIPNPAATGRFFLDNVGEARSRGFELEMRTKLNKAWQLFAGFGLTDAEFERYTDPSTGADLSGNALPNVPEWSWNAGIQNRIELSDQVAGRLRAEVVGIGDMEYDAANTTRQGDYVIANFRAGIEGDGWHLDVYVENAFDKETVVVAIPSSFSPSGFVGSAGPPRVIGISLRLDF